MFFQTCLNEFAGTRWFVLVFLAALASPGAVSAKCRDNGSELRLSAPESSQGSLLRAEFASVRPLEEVRGEWNGHEIWFWKEAASRNGASTGGRNLWAAFLGVDLEQAAGKYEFKVKANSQNTEAPDAKAGREGQDAEKAAEKAVSCSADVEVREGKFVTESLRVENQFVQPNAAQLARAQEDTKHLREIFAGVTPERLWAGRFEVPLAGVKTGKNFGTRRILNGHAGSPHGGLDMPAPTGTLVHASQRGRVALAEPLYFSGNTVIVDHGLGIYTFYGHLSFIGVKVGDLVDAGAVLGKVGATGRVTGPHLHWGLTVNRARVNPLQIVAKGTALRRAS